MSAYRRSYSLILFLILVMECPAHAASAHYGYVRFGGLPMPGAVVLATQGDRQIRTITDSQGAYSFANLSEGSWTLEVKMPGFSPIRRDLTIVPDSEATVWELKMLSIGDMKTELSPGFIPSLPAAATPLAPVSAADTVAPDDVTSRTAEALLINGSVNSGESRAFGNLRGGPPLYTADLNLTANNSAFDARSFSLTGQDSPKPTYSRSEGSIILDGPFRIPFLLPGGPRLTVIYDRAQNRNVSLQTTRLPTALERSGNFSNNANVIIDPATGVPFPGNVIPPERISPQARALMRFYPLPNFASQAGYNYQDPIAGVTHRDNLQLQTGGFLAGQHLSGSFGLQSTRTDSSNLFAFGDRLSNTVLNGTLGWSHRFTQSFSATGSYTFRRTAAKTIPHFSNRENVSGDAGINGNAQDPRNWGPPSLQFSSGMAALSDGQHAFDRTQSSAISYNSSWSRGNHAISFGSSFLRQQFNLQSEQDARGTLTFTGAASGIDFADFLLGVPTASSIAFGNPDRHFRQSGYDVFVMDDWRLATLLTLNLGVRWEYESPITERDGRLVNLDITPGFEAVAPVFASQPRGSLTGRVYPSSLVRPDQGGVQPRIGLAWRPRRDSSLVVRAGYGLYRDTSVYRSIAGEMAQQSPFSTRLSLESNASFPLTLANAFIASPLNTPSTFAVEPDFRVGYAQNWQLSLQQDLPAALQVTGTYLGIKGTHLQQRQLPNTFPSGAPARCGACPAGFVYLTSNGNSSQHAGTIQIRRRQRNGFAASVEYTWSRAIDDSGLGGFHIAQDWQDQRAERALSSFDQRHRVTAQMQYTTGMLAGIGTLQDAWVGTLLRDWTVITEWRVSSGSPLTPIMMSPVQGTGVTGSLRPDRNGALLYAGAPGVFVNRSAFSLPTPGEWGNAGRNSIAGPGQFFLDASIGRAFRLDEGIGVDLRVDFTNVLNHVTFANWNTVINSAQFGLPTGANSMRTVRPSLRVRF